MAAIRSHLTFANVMSAFAVFIALGGGAYAAVKANSVGSKQLKTNAVKNSDLAANAVTSPKVANGSLLGEDFAAGQIPSGAQGLQGAQGATGPQGPTGSTGATGTVDTSNFYDKTDSDARFLGIGATAVDSDALGGISEDSYPSTTRDNNVIASNGIPKLGFARRSLAAGAGVTQILSIGLLGAIQASCSDPAAPSISYRNSQGTAEDLWVHNMIGGAAPTFVSLAGGASSAPVTGPSAVADTRRWQFIVGSGSTASAGARIGVFDVTVATAPGGIADNTCLIQVQSQSFTS